MDLPGDKHEIRLGERLRKELSRATHILDIHTTTAQTPAFCITTKAKPFFEHTNYIPLQKHVHMSDQIAQGRSVIDLVENGIALEFSHTTTPKDIAQVVSESIRNIVCQLPHYSQKERYLAYGVHSHPQPELLHDFVQTDYEVKPEEFESFYPVLVSHVPGKAFRCMKANKIN